MNWNRWRLGLLALLLPCVTNAEFHPLDWMAADASTKVALLRALESTRFTDCAMEQVKNQLQQVTFLPNRSDDRWAFFLQDKLVQNQPDRRVEVNIYLHRRLPAVLIENKYSLGFTLHGVFTFDSSGRKVTNLSLYRQIARRLDYGPDEDPNPQLLWSIQATDRCRAI